MPNNKEIFITRIHLDPKSLDTVLVEILKTYVGMNSDERSVTELHTDILCALSRCISSTVLFGFIDPAVDPSGLKKHSLELNNRIAKLCRAYIEEEL